MLTNKAQSLARGIEPLKTWEINLANHTTYNSLADTPSGYKEKLNLAKCITTYNYLTEHTYVIKQMVCDVYAKMARAYTI